jgi:hypothetical protein
MIKPIRTKACPGRVDHVNGAEGQCEWRRSTILSELVVHDDVRRGSSAYSPGSRERWRLRYGRALARLREAGIPTRADSEPGAREYVELHAKWEPSIEALAPALGFTMEEVDTAGYSGVSSAPLALVREASSSPAR